MINDKHQYELILSLVFVFLLLVFSVYAHGEEAEITNVSSDGLVDYFASTSVYYVLLGSAIVILITLISIFYRRKSEKTKWVLFLLILKRFNIDFEVLRDISFVNLHFCYYHCQAFGRSFWFLFNGNWSKHISHNKIVFKCFS